MAVVWDDRTRFLLWLDVERAVCAALTEAGRIPRVEGRKLDAKLARIAASGGINPARVDALEKVTRHDMIAFTTALARRVGPLSRYVHFGLTSSDVVDTALSLQVARAGRILIEDMKRLERRLKVLANRYRGLPTIGRSHGIFAEPTSFGLKFLGWHVEWVRARGRLSRALEGLGFGKLSGAVGVSPHWSPVFEAKALRRLGLRREPVSTQVVPRDRHAEFLAALAIAGGSLERMAVELRHLQRSEVGEVREGFRPGQKGSSAMPHKRNPISSENLTGIARLLRAYAQAAFENIALWHERDISHSSVERVILPDATIALDYALCRMEEVLERLEVLQDRVRENLKKAGSSVYSGHLLLALVEAGASREAAYTWIQECALRAIDQGEDFISIAMKHPKITKLIDEPSLRQLGSIKYQLRNVKRIFDDAQE